MFRKISSWLNHLKKIIYILTKRQRILMIVLLLIIVVCAAIQTISVYAISPLVTSMTNKDMFMDSKIVRLLAEVCQSNDYTIVFCTLCIGISLLYFIKELMCIFQSWYSIKFAQKVQRELSREVLGSFMAREYDFFLDYGTPKVIRDVKDDPTTFYNMLTCLVNIITEALTASLLLIYVVVSDIRMALCMGGITVACLITMFYGFKRHLLKAGTEVRIRSAENQKILLETVEGVKEVQVMKKQKYFVDAFFDSYIRYQKPQTFQNMAASIPSSIVEGIFVIGIMMYLCVNAAYDDSFWTKLPMLASFLVAGIRLLPSIGRITNNVNNIQFCIPALNSVYDNIKLIRNVDVPLKMPDYGGNDSILNFKKELKLRGISYHYDDSEKKVLDNLDLTIKKGESVGIIGHSGAGKSTLADIILGLHIPQSGSIEIDGTNISDVPYEYGKVIGYVPQNVYLVDGSIRDNVAFGVEVDKIDEARLLEALKQAKLYDYVMKLENGLDTIVGERGVKFSGGQRQRLAIARALYRRPQILILDEATSALDNETEKAVMEQVEEMQGTITLIIIAHRLSTIEKCDSVYEISGGKAVKQVNI